MPSKKLEEQLFKLRMAAKELERSAKQCDKSGASERVKLKKAISRGGAGSAEAARIHAESVIRHANQAVAYRRLAARVDGVAARVQTAVTMRKVTKSMSGVVKGMSMALSSMDLEKVGQLMDRFERECENLDVQGQVLESSMANSGTLTAPQAQIDALVQETADEAGIELSMQLPEGGRTAVGSGSRASATGTASANGEQDELTQRLASLRNQ